MSFQPIIVGTGLVGWQFLKSTQDTQKAVFEKSAGLKRDTEYFAAEIANVSTAEELVSDRRLLRVALGAFGLQDDIDNKAFIKKVLDEGVTDSDALANKLTDDRYKALAKAFQFDSPFGPRTTRTVFPTEIIDKFHAQEFEISVGDQDETLRLAMNAERTLPEISGTSISDDAKWFRVMGTPPLRKVFETALGLPSGFGQLDIDQQLGVFRDKVESRFGVKEVSDIANDPELMQKLVQTYLLQAEAQSFAQTSAGTIALSLLQSIPRTSILG
jgi:hypothetical protein